MAMAPMQTVREAVTTASTNRLSCAFPVFCFSHSPNRPKAPSRFSSSPITAPMVRYRITSMAPRLTMAPFSTVSICSKAPVTAMNRGADAAAHCQGILHILLEKTPKQRPSRASGNDRCRIDNGSHTLDCREGKADPMSESFLQMAGVFPQSASSTIPLSKRGSCMFRNWQWSATSAEPQ